jgi:hypothetical protein
MNLNANIGALALPFFFCAAIVTLMVSIFVYKDAKAIQATSGHGVKIMPPEVWLLFCLVGSIPAVALYWAAHHSTLAK